MGKNKVYSPSWVMGGGKGIGAEIAKLLSQHNSHVLVSSRSGISNNISMSFDYISDCMGDLEDYDDMERHLNEFKIKGIDIEVVYYCVHRPFIPSNVEAMDWSSIEEQFIGCLKPFNNLITAISKGKLNKLKSVLVLSTNTLDNGDDLFAHRNIAKGSLESYVKSVSKVDAFSKISFNSIPLGYVDTPQLRDYIKQMEAIAGISDSFMPYNISSISDTAKACIKIGHGVLNQLFIEKANPHSQAHLQFAQATT